MSDLGAIFHVKKAGVQYDAHAYTTTNECPEPNLKIKFRGTQAYIKLEARGRGDVPCYVKKRDGGVFQVIKSAVPNGAISVGMGTVNFTVPSGITVVMITGIKEGKPVGDKSYIGVTPGKTYTLTAYIKPPDIPPLPPPISFLKNVNSSAVWIGLVDIIVNNFTISWSHEINKHAVNVNDY